MKRRLQPGKKHFVICLRNDGYPGSLEVRKIYRRIRDTEADKLNLVRIVDESGEDYLFPAEYFCAVDLPPATVRALNQAA